MALQIREETKVSLRINLNTAALSAHRQLAETDSSLSKTIERLSSGYKINSAADDPAGLVISEKLRAQIGGLQQAIKNAGDAVNMVKTAEGALTEVSRLLRSMRDLAVHAANVGGNDDAARAADQSQVVNALASLDKIAAETQFGQKKLLDGSAGTRAIVTGNAVKSGDLSYATSIVQGDVIDIEITQAAEKAFVETDVAIPNTGIGVAGSFYVNGVKVDYAATDTEVELAQKVNAVQSQTNVYAVADTANHTVEFYSVGYGSNQRVDLVGMDTTNLNSLAQLSDTGLDVQASVQTSAGLDVSDATWMSGSGTVLKDSKGNVIDLTIAAATSAATTQFNSQLQIAKGSLTFQVGAYAGQTREISIPSMYCKDLAAGVVPGQTLADLDLIHDPQNAILILDQAIKETSTIRADLGAMQTNVFESSIKSLSIANENIAASESTIRDTDMAAEMANLTRNQILEQAGTAMLAQANQIPQTLLKLLQ
jgi:flagellin